MQEAGAAATLQRCPRARPTRARERPWRTQPTVPGRWTSICSCGILGGAGGHDESVVGAAGVPHACRAMKLWN